MEGVQDLELDCYTGTVAYTDVSAAFALRTETNHVRSLNLEVIPSSKKHINLERSTLAFV